MSVRVRVVIPARNEQARIGAMLDSVTLALGHARAAGVDWDVRVRVVLDRCSDATASVARAWGAELLVCGAPFGKVEALRTGMDPQADVHVFSDADVVWGERTLFDLVRALLDEPARLAACPPLSPEPACGTPTPLGWALHRYNAARGFSSERLWLSGRCYALRTVAFPDAEELATRVAKVARGRRFPGLSGPLVADDVWLSRALLAQGPHAIVHVDSHPVRYRAPRSYRDMSRVYRRLRRELRRVDLLFPELPAPGRDRRVDRLDGLRDRLAMALFQLALLGCKVDAWAEEQLARLGDRAPDPWPVVLGSKR